MGLAPTFNKADDKLLRALFKRGLSRPQIAYVMGRTVKAVEWRMSCLCMSLVERDRKNEREVAKARAVIRADRARRALRANMRKAMKGQGASDVALVLASGAQGVTTKRAALSASVRSDLGQSTPLPLRGRAKREGLTGQNQTEPSPLALRAAQPAPKPFPSTLSLWPFPVRRPTP